jgi:hypothetical protein
VVSYRLVQIKSNGDYEEYDGVDLELDDEFTISVDTTNSTGMFAYIEASTLDSESFIYLPI